MLRLIALTTLLATPVRAQFADTPFLADTLSAIQLQSHALQVDIAANAAPDVSKFPIRGIDISRCQKAIDWTKLKTDGLSFVFMEATHGFSFVDDQFQANWKGSATANIARSAYHFYDFCQTGSAQADYFIKVTARYGLKPILYINYSIYDQYLKGGNDGYKLWIADPRSKTPNMPDNQSWAFWQYNWHGKIAGLDEEVDLKQSSGVMYASLR